MQYIFDGYGRVSLGGYRCRFTVFKGGGEGGGGGGGSGAMFWLGGGGE